jgi:RNA-directed DNA polymerase
MGKGLWLIQFIWGHIVGITKPEVAMETKLNKIANLSYQDRQMKFGKLMPHFTKENLISCFNELDGNKAVGIDGKTKAAYAENLEENIRELMEKMKALAYRPQPVREVLIPKGNGKFRTLGISNIEEKIAQLMFSKILEAIYEPMFCDCSYGFRRDKSAHGAIRDAIEFLKFNNVKRVIDVDLENFFGTINHQELMRMLATRIEDKTFLRYISRMLKAGKYTGIKIERSKDGLMQGSILSPVLANIYAHYVIDLWFKKVVPKHIIGKVGIFRFCDDFVICCTDTRDVPKIINTLGKRLGKFSLKLNLEKTKIVKFNRYDFDRNIEQENFDFLGFTFYISKALRGGFTTIKVKTSKKTLRTKLANVKLWLQNNRFAGGLRDVWLEFCRKLKGHIAYFGVTSNSQSVAKFLWKSRRLFFKWMNRRSQRRSFNWEKFTIFEKQYPMPSVKIHHRIYKSLPKAS